MPRQNRILYSPFGSFAGLEKTETQHKNFLSGRIPHCHENLIRRAQLLREKAPKFSAFAEDLYSKMNNIYGRN